MVFTKIVRKYLLTSKKNENNYIDFLKGLLIFLVVLGHELQSSNLNFDDLFLFKLIYSFHMPFFIVISGYLGNMSLKRSGCSFSKCIIHKLNYLIVPYFLWWIVSEISTQTLSMKSIYSLINHVDQGLWYLYVLFILYISLFISSKLQYKYSILFGLLILIPMTNLFGMKLVKWYLSFFIIGMLLFDYQLVVKNIFIKYIIPIKYLIIILFLISLIYWRRELMSDSIFSNTYYLYVYKFFVSILGMISVYLLTYKFYSLNCLNDMLNIFGKNSMKIYILNIILMNYIIQYINISNEVFLILMAFFICYFIVITTNILLKIRFLKLFFGEFKIPKSITKA